jgi:hypothetical protein
VTGRVTQPTVDDIQLAIHHLTEATGKPPTVLALAGQLGLSNTTFRRHFPDIAADLKQRRARDPASPAAAASRFDQLQHDNAALRRDNRQLREHLDLAAANIQRLTLENHRLRQQLEATAKVTTMGRRPASGHCQVQDRQQ